MRSATLTGGIDILVPMIFMLGLFASPCLADDPPTQATSSTSETQKDQVSQEVHAALRAGHPEIVLISFDDSSIEADSVAERQERHLYGDDDIIIAEKRARYKELKKQVLDGYSNDDLLVIKDYRSTAQVEARIYNHRTLERLLGDPRVSYIYSAQRVYPVSVGPGGKE